MSERDQEKAREAREALERVRRDTETLGSSALARMGRQAGEHFGAKDAVGAGRGRRTHPIELWGRRTPARCRWSASSSSPSGFWSS